MRYLIKNKEWKLNKDYNIDKILYLLVDRPTYINFYDDEFIWKNNKEYWHRDYDLPACFDQQEVSWYKNSILHRKNNKPAIILHNGDKFFYKNGYFIKEKINENIL